MPVPTAPGACPNSPSTARRRSVERTSLSPSSSIRPRRSRARCVPRLGVGTRPTGNDRATRRTGLDARTQSRGCRVDVFAYRTATDILRNDLESQSRGCRVDVFAPGPMVSGGVDRGVSQSRGCRVDVFASHVWAACPRTIGPVSIPWVPGRRVRPCRDGVPAPSTGYFVSIPWVPGRRVRLAEVVKVEGVDGVVSIPWVPGRRVRPATPPPSAASSTTSQSRGCRVDVFASSSTKVSGSRCWGLNPVGAGSTCSPRPQRGQRARRDGAVSIPWVPGRRVRPCSV